MKKNYFFLSKYGFFLILFFINFSIFAQKETYNFRLDKVPLTDFIKKIDNSTDYKVIYNPGKISTDHMISVNLEGASMEDVLREALKDLPIAFQIRDNQIILLSKQTTAQTSKVIHGKVSEAWSGIPIMAATVIIKGTNTGALTNSKGEFDLKIPSPANNLVLEVSYIGKETVQRKIGNQSIFNIELEESLNELDQVVVTSSYGTKALREEIVGSISTIVSEEIPTNQASESIDKMLEGQLAGVLVENTSGIGGPVKINIRGQGSLSPLGNANLGTSTQPLIIVDGVTMTEEMAIDNNFFDGNGTFAESLNNPLAQLSSEDIESISVLKDAAAVSIYGADGANGVIIITTKKGKTQKTQFNFSMQNGISEAINEIQYLNGRQYTEVRNAYLQNTGQPEIFYNGVDTDWFDLMNTTGIYQKYNLNASGLKNNFNYRASLTYSNIDEPQVGNGSEQYNLNTNLGYSGERFSADLILNPSYIRRNTPNIYYNYAFLPTIAAYDENGDYADVGVSGLANPLAAAEQNRNRSETKGLLGSFRVAYKVLPMFEVSSLFGLDYKEKEQDRYFSALNESGRYNGNFVLNGEQYPSWGRRVLNDRDSKKWNWQTQASYDGQFGGHNLDLLAGIELSEEKTDFHYASGRGFVNPNIINDVSDALQDDDPDTDENETLDNQSYDFDINYNSRVSFYSQLNYDYLGKYFALVNFRRDESSVFGTDTNVAYNGGLGLSWIVTKENFLKNISWLDLLKIKASYGTTGNSRIGSYRSKGLYNTGVGGYNGLEEAYPSAAPNPRLSWEKNTKLNIGTEISLFDRFRLGVDYYYDDIEDLITSRDIPTETGYSSLQLNAASMYNKGLEISLNADLISSTNFDWNASFNIATLENEVTDLVGLGSDYSIASNALAQKIGYSTSTIWGVNWIGVDPATGRDLVSKNGQVYDAATYNALFENDAWEPLGDRQPDVYGGFSTRFTLFKDLQLSVYGSYQLGSEYVVSHELISQYRITFNRNLSVNAYDFWRNQGDRVTQPVPGNNPIISNMSKYVYDDSYIKINSINLTYKIPVENIGFLDNLSVFVNASNVAYWYRSDSPAGLNGIRELRYTYPQARTISCGLNTRF